MRAVEAVADMSIPHKQSHQLLDLIGSTGLRHKWDMGTQLDGAAKGTANEHLVAMTLLLHSIRNPTFGMHELFPALQFCAPEWDPWVLWSGPVGIVRAIDAATMKPGSNVFEQVSCDDELEHTLLYSLP